MIRHVFPCRFAAGIVTDRWSCRLTAAAALALSLALIPRGAAAQGPRRPVAIAVTGDRAWVAEERTGRLTCLDLRRLEPVREMAVGRQLTDALSWRGRWVLASDGQEHCVHVLDTEGDPRLVATLPAPQYPSTLCVSLQGDWLSVGGLWSRRLMIYQLAETEKKGFSARLLHRIDLPVAPGTQCATPDGRLVVADAFQGKMCLVDPGRGTVESLRLMDGHNIAGLAVAEDRLAIHVAHQLINSSTSTTESHVFWGGVISNVIRTVPLDQLEGGDPIRGAPLAHWTLLPLGRPGDGAGDPGALAISPDHVTVVVLRGVHEVAVRTAPKQPMMRYPVGRGPWDVAWCGATGTFLVANRWDDSVTLLDGKTGRPIRTIPLGRRPDQLSLADQGEVLFYDARLSLDGWYSCHSCHTLGHSADILNDNFGDDTFGAPKRVLPLGVVAVTGPWAWYGHRATLREQISKSLQATMRYGGDSGDARLVEALEAYLARLPSPPGIDVARQQVDPAAVRRGRAVFQAAGCAECHQPPHYTSEGVHDVGFEDERGHQAFNPPSLLGVSQRARLFHDGRAASLEEALGRWGHGGADTLGPEELRDLLAFLRQL